MNRIPSVRLRSLLTVLITCAALGASPAAAAKNRILAAGSHAWGASLVTWQERWSAWALGSRNNPTATDICGEKVGNVFFLNTTVDLGVKRVECHPPPGTRLLALVAGSFVVPSFPPAHVETDQELLDEARTLDATDHPRATLDGSSLGTSLTEASRRFTPVYTIPLERGNFWSALDPTFNTVDETRQASAGWWLRLNPLRPGHHELFPANDVPGLARSRSSSISRSGTAVTDRTPPGPRPRRPPWRGHRCAVRE
jgi:hypothetical protein